MNTKLKKAARRAAKWLRKKRTRRKINRLLFWLNLTRSVVQLLIFIHGIW